VDLQTNLGSYDGGPLAATKQYTSDILFTYQLHPGTAIYVGYNDGLDNLSLDNSLLPPQVRYTLSGMHLTSQLFFIKMSYLLRD
jgi:hypothetical protein